MRRINFHYLLLAIALSISAPKAKASDTQIFTNEDMKFCENSKPIPAQTSYIDPLTLPDNGSVYQAGSNRWSQEEEIRYAQWVRDNVGTDFMQIYKIPTDCAKAAAAIRIIYSRIRNLPFLITNTKQSVAFDSQSWKNLPRVNDWTGDNWKTALKPENDKRFRAYLNAAMNTIYTGSINSNLYPIRLSDEKNPNILSQYFHEGTVILTPPTAIHKSEGHTRWISSIRPDLSETRFFPIREMASNSPVEIRSLIEDTFSIPFQNKIGYGALNWLWPVHCAGGWGAVKPQQMPGYDLEQYGYVGHSSVEEMKETIKSYELQITNLEKQIEKLNAKPASNNSVSIQEIRGMINAYKQSTIDEKISLTELLSGRKKTSSFSTSTLGSLVNKLARDPNVKFPNDEEIEKQINSFCNRIKERAIAVNDALKKFRGNPHIFDNLNSIAYSDASTPERDRQDLEAIQPFIDTIVEMARENDYLTGPFLGKMIGINIDIGGGQKMNPLSYYTLLKAKKVSSNPNDSFEKRWGLDSLSAINQDFQNRPELTTLERYQMSSFFYLNAKIVPQQNQDASSVNAR